MQIHKCEMSSRAINDNVGTHLKYKVVKLTTSNRRQQKITALLSLSPLKREDLNSTYMVLNNIMLMLH